MRLKDKVALVTGASGGIGRGICRALAAEGAAVAVHYNRDAAGAEETVAQIAESGVRTTIVQADLTDRSQVESLIDKRLGHITEQLRELRRVQKVLKSTLDWCRNPRSWPPREEIQNV